MAERSFQAWTMASFGKAVPKWSQTSFHWTGRYEDEHTYVTYTIRHSSDVADRCI